MLLSKEVLLFRFMQISNMDGITGTVLFRVYLLYAKSNILYFRSAFMFGCPSRSWEARTGCTIPRYLQTCSWKHLTLRRGCTWGSWWWLCTRTPSTLTWCKIIALSSSILIWWKLARCCRGRKGITLDTFRSTQNALRTLILLTEGLALPFQFHADQLYARFLPQPPAAQWS